VQKRRGFPWPKINSAMAAATRVVYGNVMRCGKRMLFLETEPAMAWWVG
jgi:hypothetical protein